MCMHLVLTKVVGQSCLSSYSMYYSTSSVFIHPSGDCNLFTELVACLRSLSKFTTELCQPLYLRPC